MSDRLNLSEVREDQRLFLSNALYKALQQTDEEVKEVRVVFADIGIEWQLYYGWKKKAVSYEITTPTKKMIVSLVDISRTKAIVETVEYKI